MNVGCDRFRPLHLTSRTVMLPNHANPVRNYPPLHSGASWSTAGDERPVDHGDGELDPRPPANTGIKKAGVRFLLSVDYVASTAPPAWGVEQSLFSLDSAPDSRVARVAVYCHGNDREGYHPNAIALRTPTAKGRRLYYRCYNEINLARRGR